MTLQALREQAHLSLTEAASRLDVILATEHPQPKRTSRITVYLWERGSTQPRQWYRRAMATLYQVSYDEIDAAIAATRLQKAAVADDPRSSIFEKERADE